MFTAEHTKHFSYDPSTGIITRTIASGNRKAGTPCTNTLHDLYLQVCFKGKFILQHRLAWYLYYGEQLPQQIDHIDRNPLNPNLLES